MAERKSKDIYIRQNEDDMLNLLKAQRLVYSSAKWHIIFLFLCFVFLPLSINIIIPYLPQNSNILMPLLSSAILVLFVLGHFFRSRLKEKKVLATYIQQKFDTYVFDMQEVYQKYIKFKTHLKENIRNAVRKYENVEEANLENWYSDYSNLPYEHAVFYCQKENFNWSLKLSNKYRYVLKMFFMLVILIIIINAIINLSSVNHLILILTTLLPLFSHFYDSYQKITKDIQSLRDIVREIEQTEMKLDSLNNEKLNEITKELQEKIFLHRQKAYLIPNPFYRFLRNHFQITEDDSAKDINSQHKPKKKQYQKIGKKI